MLFAILSWKKIIVLSCVVLELCYFKEFTWEILFYFTHDWFFYYFAWFLSDLDETNLHLGVLDHAEFIFYTYKLLFWWEVFKLQIWPSDEKSWLCDVHKFEKIDQLLTIFLFDGTLQVSKIFSVYLYDFTLTWKIVNFGQKIFAYSMTDFQLFYLVFVWLS